MFRKVLLALTATIALSTVALAPTTASAGGWKKGHHGHHGHHGKWGHGHRLHIGFYAPAYTYGLVGGCYSVKRWVATPFGPKFRRVTVCN